MSPPEVWGPPIWTLFHVLAEKINERAYPFYAGQLCKNAVVVESTLRGIRSTNLEGPSFSATPEVTPIGEKQLFTVNPTYIPQPYYHSTVERPLYLN